jgi:uncharacterized membrane protein YebE (DUF533 family)
MPTDKQTILEQNIAENPNYLANLQAENKKNEDAANLKRKLLLGSGVAVLGYSAYKMESKKEFVAALGVGFLGFSIAVGGALGGGSSKTTEIAAPFMIVGSASYIVTRGIFQKSIPTSLKIASLCGGLFLAYQYYQNNKTKFNSKQQLGQQYNTQIAQPIQATR